MKKKRRKSSKRNDRGQGVLPFGRAKRASGCGCSGKCCSAAGTRCACKCHGRNHGAKVVYRNPPAQKAARMPRIRVGVIGAVESITYRRGGKRWRHHVTGRARLLAPTSGDYVVIDGIKVSKFLEG